jgi:hypothetical protein
MAGGFAVARVSVGTTAGGTLLAAARPGRVAVTIINEGTADVRLGNAGVTTSIGALLTGLKGASVTIPTSDAVYAIVGSGTQNVSVIESY